MEKKLISPDRKCLLSIDGGGIRGILSIQILKKIEKIAEKLSGNPDIRLCDCFDYIGGTSTGGIIAAALALGMRTGDVEAFYHDHSSHMFLPNHNFVRRFTAGRCDSSELSQKLQDVFGKDTTLGSPALKTLLMLVMLNASTSSPWPLSSNPKAKYNDLHQCGESSNLHLPLWQLVRAGAAAPYLFEPEPITIEKKQYLFFDGALTSYNNPAFKLFQMATLPQYKLEWPTGADQMLLVSVGTGMLSHAIPLKNPNQVDFRETLPAAIQSLMYSSTAEQDLLCRSFAKVLAGDAIDGEVGSLVQSTPIGNTSLFSYLRYNADLSSKALVDAGFERFKSTSFSIDSVDAVQPCAEIGQWVAEKAVHQEHFEQFWKTTTYS
jgi:hypothetical protein